MSVTTFAPPVPLDGPPPVAPPFNLFTVARPIGDPRAPVGVAVIPYPCGVPHGHNPCATGSDAQKQSDVRDEMPIFAGFTSYLSVTCTRSAVGDDASFTSKLTSVLDATDHLIAADQLAFGSQQPLNPYLDDSNATSLGSHTAAVALGLLEGAIGETGREGVIHAGLDTVAAWGFDLLPNEGGVLRTILNTPVIASAAYGTGKAWASGPVIYERGPAEVIPGSRAQAMDRQTNEVIYFAERDLVVGWDGCLQAVVT